MLSENVMTLADHLRQYRHDGMILEPAAVESWLVILESFAAEAVALERQPMPVALQRPAAPSVYRDALPPGVVDLMQRRRTRGTALAGHGPDGGAP